MREKHRRLEMVFRRLSARDRARLTLRAFKGEAEEDLLVRRTMPANQRDEYNRRIVLINTVNSGLGAEVVVLQMRVRQLAERVDWLGRAHLAGSAIGLVREYIDGYVAEPVTAEERELLREAQANEFVAIRSLAKREARRSGESVSKSLKKLRDLARAGVLESKAGRRDLLIRAGSYYAWTGQEVPVRPLYGRSVALIDDEREGEMHVWRAERGRLERLLDVTSHMSQAHLEPLIYHETRYLSAKVEALRLLVEEAASEFDGEDPWPSERREVFKSAASLLEHTGEEAKELLRGELKPGTDEDVFQLMQQLRQQHTLPGAGEDDSDEGGWPDLDI